MNRIADQDHKMLADMPKDKLLDLFFLHIRNLWRVDGLYFLGIEKTFGTEAATDIDTNCWKIMGKIEAKDLKTLLATRKNDIPSLMYALRNTGWSLDQKDKEIEVSEKRGIFRVVKCHTQLTRIRKGLEVFPCKNVRFTYLKAFAEEFNPNIKVESRICPPGERPANVWCEWEFILRK
ncbi:MAG: DUF6125 family protein [Candidatus Bathyarchaeota archaeon]|jgi:hypothetical protein